MEPTETSFQRVHRLAAEATARKQAAAKAWRREHEAIHGRGSWRQLWDERDDPSMITVLYPAQQRGISTHEGRAYNRHQLVKRPTEVTALKHAAGYGTDHYQVQRRSAVNLDPKCAGCKRQLKPTAFARDKRFPNGRAAWCKDCRAALKDRTWRRIEVPYEMPKAA